MPHEIREVTDQTFDTEVLAADTPTVVDFKAVHCAPCRALLPTLVALAADYQGRVSFATVDVDEQPITAQRFGVRAMPTLLFFKQGKVVAQIVGAVARGRIEEAIRKAL